MYYYTTFGEYKKYNLVENFGQVVNAKLRPKAAAIVAPKVTTSELPIYTFSNNIYSEEFNNCLILPKFSIKLQSKNTSIDTYNITSEFHGHEIDLNIPHNRIQLSKLPNNFLTIINITNSCELISDSDFLYTIPDLSGINIDNKNYLCTGGLLFSNAIKTTKSINIKANQQFYIFTDHKNCDLTKTNKNTYVYINNNKKLTNCINYFQLPNATTANTEEITSQYNGYILNIPNCKSLKLNTHTTCIKNTCTNLDDFKIRPYITIINTSNKSFNNTIYPISSVQPLTSDIGTIICKKSDNIKYNMYVMTIDLNKINKINKKNRNGPYSQINYYGNPVIIIYSPPYIDSDKDDKDKYKGDKDKGDKDKDDDSQDSLTNVDIYVNVKYI
jgi:hypothetical protein